MTTRVPSAALGLLVISSVVVGAGCRKADLRFDVTFKDAHGLQAGHPVVVGDAKAGEVVAVTPASGGGVRVTVRIDRKHKDSVYREAAFVVEKPGGFFDQGTARQIRVRDRGSVRTPLEPGDVVAGAEPALDEVLGKLGAIGAKALDALRGWADRGAQFARELPDSEDARQLREALARFSEQARVAAADQVEAFQREQLPELKARAERYRQSLEKAGRSAEAKRFAEQFERWILDAAK